MNNIQKEIIVNFYFCINNRYIKKTKKQSLNRKIEDQVL